MPKKRQQINKHKTVQDAFTSEVRSQISDFTVPSSAFCVTPSSFPSSVKMSQTPFSVSKPPPAAQKNKKATLEIGTINLCLHVPGLVDILVPIPAPESVHPLTHLNEIFKTFENKYWIKVQTRFAKGFKCLVCEDHYQSIRSIQYHVAKHMGFPIARCTKCSKSFYSMTTANKHIKSC